MTNNEHDWGNYWQGRNANNQTSEEALVGVGIENDAVLTNFWQGHFTGLETSCEVLDMACGAGSVLKHAKKLGMVNLTGVDISKDAISTLEKNILGVRGIVSPVNQIPLKDNTFDIAVSQFGFEYAGDINNICETAREMARLIKKDGRIVTLCHIKGGGIDEEVSEHILSVQQIEDTHFIVAAKQLFQAAFAVEQDATEINKSTYQHATQKLSRPVEMLSAWIKDNQNKASEIVGLARHLHAGTIDMFNRRRAFDLTDIIGWLEGMSAEMQAYKGRMLSMKRAALSEAEANKILDAFNAAGLTVEKLDKLFLQDDDKPVAWILQAQGYGK